jgi:hypothetical protein
MEQLEALNKCLQNIGKFTLSEVEQISLHCTYKTVRKNEHLLRLGQVCNSINFMLAGACYQYRPGTDAGHIIELYAALDCIVSPASFFFQKPAEEVITAYTDCELLTLSIHSLHQLIGLSPVFFQLGKVLQPGWFRVGFYDQGMSPAEKYKHLLQNKPEIIQTFPLKIIASYLKITPETLSRVRAVT